VTMKLDLGCGKSKKEGFYGVDAIAFPGVDAVCDLRQRWPWDDGTVEEAHSSHFIEHLEAMERVHFANELYRVLQPGGKCTLIVPHWASCRAYGDPTHKWPPVSEFWFFYLSREWRMQEAPHTDAEHLPGGFACDFEATWGYVLDQPVSVRNQEAQVFMLRYYKEAAQDTVSTLTARK
jgi:hypothetical protein